MADRAADHRAEHGSANRRDARDRRSDGFLDERGRRSTRLLEQPAKELDVVIAKVLVAAVLDDFQIGLCVHLRNQLRDLVRRSCVDHTAGHDMEEYEEDRSVPYHDTECTMCLEPSWLRWR